MERDDHAPAVADLLPDEYLMAVLLQPPPQDWDCPNCSTVDRTVGRTNRWHQCAGLAGILAPLLPVGSGARVYTVERDDFIRGDLVQRDGNGQVVMAVVTERPDGSNDVLVNVPTARITGSAQ